MSEVPQGDDIPLPKSENHAIRAAEEVKLKAAWIRKYGSDLGVDISKWQLGYVLDTIINDDSNCFVWAHPNRPQLPDQAFQEEAQTNGDALLQRLAWEASIPEVPQDIKDILSAEREALSKITFSDRSAFTYASEHWNSMKEQINEAVSKDPQLADALMYPWNLAMNNPEVDKVFAEFRTSVMKA